MKIVRNSFQQRITLIGALLVLIALMTQCGDVKSFDNVQVDTTPNYSKLWESNHPFIDP